MRTAWILTLATFLALSGATPARAKESRSQRLPAARKLMPRFVRLDCERATVLYDKEKLFVGPKRLDERMELKRDRDGAYRGVHHFLMGDFRITLKGYYKRNRLELEAELKRRVGRKDDFELVNTKKVSSDDLEDADRFEAARRKGMLLVHASLVNHDAKAIIAKGKEQGRSLQELLANDEIESGTLNFVNVSCRLKR